MKILVVDDMPAWREFHKNNIEEFFIEQGCEIHLASSAREGLEKLYENTQSPYDIIVTDLQMEDEFRPKYAGEWLVEQIKTYSKYYKNCKTVIISASPSIKQIAEKHNVLYLPKTIARNSGAEVYKEFIQ